MPIYTYSAYTLHGCCIIELTFIINMVIKLFLLIDSLVPDTPFSPCRAQEKDLTFWSDWNISKTSELYSACGMSLHRYRLESAESGGERERERERRGATDLSTCSDVHSFSNGTFRDTIYINLKMLQLAASRGIEIEREILEAEYTSIADKVAQLQDKVSFQSFWHIINFNFYSKTPCSVTFTTLLMHFKLLHIMS